MISNFNRFCLFKLDYLKKPIRFDFVFGSSCIRNFDTYIAKHGSRVVKSCDFIEEHFALFECKNKSWYLRCMYYLNPSTFERVFYHNEYKGLIDVTYFNNPKYDFDGLRFNLQEQYDFAVRVGNQKHV